MPHYSMEKLYSTFLLLEQATRHNQRTIDRKRHYPTAMKETMPWRQSDLPISRWWQIRFASLLALLFTAQAAAATDSGMCTVQPSERSQCNAAESTSIGMTPRLLDLSYTYQPGLPLFMQEDGLQESNFKWLDASMAKGASYYATSFKMSVHTGTHLDAPGHFIRSQFEAGNSVDKIPLDVLVGPALVLSIPSDTNITAEALRQLSIPPGCERLLLRTVNTDRDLMRTAKFHADYTGFTTDGAEYLAKETNIKLVGIDYLSVADSDHMAPAHVALLEKPIVPVEGLDLSHVVPGKWYDITCLPLKLAGAEGSPCRCIAYGPVQGPEAHELDSDSGDLESI